MALRICASLVYSPRLRNRPTLLRMTTGLDLVQPRPWWRPVLSPQERHTEIVFGLLMAVSVTGSVSVAEGGESGVRTLLIAAIGCNTAWGLVDAAMYLLTAMSERYHRRSLLAALRGADPQRGREMIADALPPLLAESFRAPELEHVRTELLARKELPDAGLTGRDFLGALGVFLLVFLSTFPVVVPFLLPLEPRLALRVSNGVAMVMLFLVGLRVGKYMAHRPLLVACGSVAVGAALVAITIALGG